ncbi:GL18151 [Drosophila persimilis]|uniref:GL18151 n=1 Tax=Drosophila persimilis TaxID=7234 RepID=B4H864_DROPE|nr:GL18151 [Drosophila persimilis]
MALSYPDSGANNHPWGAGHYCRRGFPEPPDPRGFCTAPSGDLRIYAKDADTHRKIIKILNALRVQYTHFCVSEDRNFRVTASVPKDTINQAFKKLGHRVVNLCNPKSTRSPSVSADGVRQEPPNQKAWFIDLAQGPNNKEALKIARVGRQRVETNGAAPQKQQREAVLSCAEDHWTGSPECNPITVDDLTCSNCSGKYAAYDRSCKIYVMMHKNRQSAVNVSPQNPDARKVRNVPSMAVQRGIFFADAFRRNEPKQAYVDTRRHYLAQLDYNTQFPQLQGKRRPTTWSTNAQGSYPEQQMDTSSIAQVLME